MTAPVVSGKSSADIAVSMLAHLPGWSVAPSRFQDQHFTDLVRNDGARIAIYVGGPSGWAPKDRVVFAGQWPKFRDGSNYYASEPCPRITCRADRSAEKLAGEITRRLLPAYDAAYAKASEYVAQSNAAVGEAENIAARFVSMLGAEAKITHSRRGDAQRIWAPLESIYGLSVDPAWGDSPVSVAMEIRNLAPEVAFAVLEMIQEHEARANAAPVRVEAPVSVSREISDEDEELEVVEPLRRRIA